MRRRLFNLAAAVLLVLFVATEVLSVVVRHRPVYSYNKSYVGPLILREHKFSLDPGGIQGWVRTNSDTRTPLEFTPFNLIPGFGFNLGRGPGSFYEIYFSFEFFAFVFAVLPLAWAANRGIPIVARYRARRRAARGHLCTTCGYDLRATPDRCPECGQPTHHPAVQRTAVAGQGAVE